MRHREREIDDLSKDWFFTREWDQIEIPNEGFELREKKSEELWDVHE